MRILYSGEGAPVGANVYAGTVDGPSPGYPQLSFKYPHDLLVSVTTTAHPGFLVLDAAYVSPKVVAAWVEVELAAGRRPTVKCPLVAWPAMKIAKAADWWIVDPTGRPHEVPGAAVVEYADPPYTRASYSVAIVYDESWPPSTPRESEEAEPSRKHWWQRNSS
jgi:hypothetical protein